MADLVRAWTDSSRGEATVEVVDIYGEMQEKYVIKIDELTTTANRELQNAEARHGADGLLKTVRALYPTPGITRPLLRGVAPAPTGPPAAPSAPPAAPVAAPAPPPPSNGGGQPVTAPAQARPERSCFQCPNFRPAAKVGERYSKSIGTPMCDFFDKPIGRAGDNAQQLERKAKKVGTACDAFGKPADSKPRRTFPVAFPDMRLTDPENVDDNLKANCQSCVSCKNFTPPDVVTAELGWVAGLCNAKGELVQQMSATYVGRTCDIRQFGMVRNTALVGLNLFPEYSDDFLTGDLVEEFKKLHAFDPATHESDKPVEDDERKLGIKAWKLIRDKERPEYDTKVFLPIFDPEFFDDIERSKIPQTGDDEHPELYVDHANAVYKVAVLWQHLDETPAVWGEAGNGKTELYRYLAWMMGLPFERLSITGSTDLDDLAGKYHYTKERGTYFEYGRLPRSWNKPGIICIDEPNVGPPDVWQFIRPLTDNSKQLVLDMAEGQRIPRHNSCYMGMALNPAWDPRNVGAFPIGDADQRRLMHIWMPPPPKEIEEEIIKERCKIDGYDIPKIVLNAVMSIAEELRGLSQQGTIPVTWGVAPQIKVARATRFFTLLDAYKIAVTDYLEPRQAEIIRDVVKANAPASLTTGGGNSASSSINAPWAT